MLTPAISSDKLPIVERTDLLASLASLVNAARERDTLLGVVVIDICQLDEVHHEYGYAVGDALVRTVTEAVCANKRGRDVVTRIGTHELLLVLPDLKSNGQPILAAQRILRHCAQRFDLCGRHVKPNLRFGIAVLPEDAEDAGELMHAADAALLQSRRLNRDIVTYGESLIGVQTALLETRHDLESALENGELFCHFQPKIELDTGRFSSAESLTRWQSGDGSMIPPNKFIPVAEQNGLITALTFRSLNESLRECAELQDAFPGLGVAVNLSATVFAERNLPDIILEALQIWGLPRQRLTLEVTESAMMRDVDESIRVLRGFRDLGIGISIDDFGTGHSSLAYLRRFPATELKIDRSFVRSIPANDTDRRLVQAIIDLARGFGLKTVAEGIEDADTFELLRDMGCNMAQGFHIARPMPPGEIGAWFEASSWRQPLRPRIKMTA